MDGAAAGQEQPARRRGHPDGLVAAVGDSRSVMHHIIHIIMPSVLGGGAQSAFDLLHEHSLAALNDLPHAEHSTQPSLESLHFFLQFPNTKCLLLEGSLALAQLVPQHVDFLLELLYLNVVKADALVAEV
jgi:hypothetical protein